VATEMCTRCSAIGTCEGREPLGSPSSRRVSRRVSKDWPRYRYRKYQLANVLLDSFAVPGAASETSGSLQALPIGPMRVRWIAIIPAQKVHAIQEPGAPLKS